MELLQFEEIYNEWVNNKISAVEASKLLGITRGTFYNRAKLLKSQLKK